MNLKHFLSSVSIPFSIILFLFIDEYVYDLPTLMGALLGALFVAVAITVIQSISLLDRELNKFTYGTLWIVTLVCILGSFYLFDL